MNNTVIGILAHVDAGKTTLAEAVLYKTGRVRALGRVDDKNTALDTHALERERGITIFSSEASFEYGERRFSLLDTPGHVDFSAETERTLSVLDAAILVISGTDGVQAHTRTLWKLLALYNVPTLIFVTKMDFARLERADIISQLQSELSENCFDFESPDLFESLSLCRDDILEKYLECGELSLSDMSSLLSSRLFFPCFFGSGLKLVGIDTLLQALCELVPTKKYPEAFGARVYKITHDSKGEKLAHLKITGGSLSVRDTLGDDQVHAIRVYSGGRFETRDKAVAGDICAVTGLSKSFGGEGLGFEKETAQAVLTPVMSYKIILPEGVDSQTALSKLKILEQEDPLLKFTWNGYLQQISVSLMGKVQTEILKSIVADRFGLDIEIGEGSVLYKETVSGKTEGVGHFEPLRHYAEVHLILEPLPRGSGLKFESAVSTDDLSLNWQRLILMHLSEKEHLGVLTGSPITDMKITLAAGRAHLKHTEGGDFRQSTYRAVRHGLMYADSLLLEPYYKFRLEIPTEHIGRAINDIRMKSGEFENPEDIGGAYLLCGRAPVSTMFDYAAEVASYTGGRGRLSLSQDGYDICHNPQEVIEKIGYNADSDTDNTADSVFCAHGAGFNVKWDKVTEYMHIESCIRKEITAPLPTPKINKRNLNIDEKELEALMLREFGPILRREYGIAKVKTKTHEEVRAERERKKMLIVDGYNVIFAWDELKELANADISDARDRLCEIMINYSAFTKTETVIVFDAYLVEGGAGSKFDKSGVHIVYTKENETGDAYIEKLIGEIGKNYNVSVVTSDGLIQVSAIRAGVLRLPASEFEREVDEVYEQISEAITKINKTPPVKIKLPE
ncbi:MAG: TetM/TetW/TetO/TetS family tetracycline resistance ribosomal protection protein [Clostridia bacterium]|nr:TetM/TetW/TetO/TetS family tetracycline resistance ribosomal protection protein [Clostridia bacterium]